jgi:S1-C subfamily serine protease
MEQSSAPIENKLQDDVLMEAGLQLRDLSNSEKQRLRTDGIRVIGITADSKISDTNMEEDYIITKINNEQVNSVDDFISKIQLADRRIFLDGFYEDEEGSFQYVFSK